MSTRRVRWGAAGLAALWVLATAMCIRSLAHSWMPPLDDAYIHAAFARQLAEHASLQLPGQGPGGQSSPGYAALLSPAEWGALHAAPQFALLLGAIAFILLPLLVSSLVPAELGARGAVAIVCACGGPLLFHAQSGMETLPYLSLGLGSLLAFARRRWALAGLLAAAAAWLRLDAWTLWLALAVGAVDDGRARGANLRGSLSSFLRESWLGLLLTLAALATVAASSDGLPPATFAGRRWLQGLDPEWSWGQLGVGLPAFVRDWLRALSAQFGFGNLVPLLPESWAAPMSAVRFLYKVVTALLLLDGLWQVLRWSQRRVESSALRLFLLWSLWTFLQYCLLLPSRGHAGRYQPQLLVAFLLLGAIAAAHLWPRRWTRPFVSLFLLGAVAGSITAVQLTGQAAAHLVAVHRRAADELPALLPEGARLAVFDIGILAYASDLDWLDLSGLCDRELWSAVQARSTAFYLRDRGVTHVLLPLTENDGPGSLRDRLRLSDLDDAPLLPLYEWASQDWRWGEAFQFSGNAARRLVLYALP